MDQQLHAETRRRYRGALKPVYRLQAGCGISEVGRFRKRWRTVALSAAGRAIGVALGGFRAPEAMLAEIRRRVPTSDWA